MHGSAVQVMYSATPCLARMTNLCLSSCQSPADGAGLQNRAVLAKRMLTVMTMLTYCVYLGCIHTCLAMLWALPLCHHPRAQAHRRHQASGRRVDYSVHADCAAVKPNLRRVENGLMAGKKSLASKQQGRHVNAPTGMHKQ